MMNEEAGDRNFRIWLIADSDPDAWKLILDAPLDPRHPVRHNIWTAVLEVVQERVYRSSRQRVDASRVYIRNAVQDATSKPKPTQLLWGGPVEAQICRLRELVDAHKPIFLFSFGAFSFEFMRRVACEDMPRKFAYWGARELGVEFRKRMDGFEPCKTNIVPLLHRSISGGKFIESHDYFCGTPGANYFEFVGNCIADTLLEYRNQLHVWIAPG